MITVERGTPRAPAAVPTPCFEHGRHDLEPVEASHVISYLLAAQGDGVVLGCAARILDITRQVELLGAGGTS
jgi:hypothetical protein